MFVDPGKPVSLRCEASGHPLPDFDWFLDGEFIKDDTKLPLYVSFFIQNSSTNSVLGRRVISYVNITASVEDGGVYECVARNKMGSARHSARLNVHGKAHIKSMKDIIAISGRKLMVNCPYSGYPIQSITWSKG